MAKKFKNIFEIKINFFSKEKVEIEMQKTKSIWNSKCLIKKTKTFYVFSFKFKFTQIQTDGQTFKERQTGKFTEKTTKFQKPNET